MLEAEYLRELKKVALLEKQEEQILWQRYKEEGDRESRMRLIEAYQPLVFKLVKHLQPPQHLEMDFIQEGTIGLIEAVESFVPAKGFLFSTFAQYRIRGRLYNYLRTIYQQEENKHNLADVEAVLATLPDGQPSTEEVVADSELHRRVVAAMARLPKREQSVMYALYLDDLQPKAVAAKLQISPSYLYKLQKKAVRRLRGMLTNLLVELKRG